MKIAAGSAVPGPSSGASRARQKVCDRAADQVVIGGCAVHVGRHNIAQHLSLNVCSTEAPRQQVLPGRINGCMSSSNIDGIDKTRERRRPPLMISQSQSPTIEP